MRKRVFAAVAAVLGTMTTLATPAQAITNGQPDPVHTNVGIIIFYADEAATTPTHRCTGTLIDGDTVLTAGHCTEGAAAAQIWFDQHVVRQPGGYPLAGGTMGEPITHPDFVWQIPNTSDVGVIQLTETPPQVGISSLAPVGYLDDLATQRGRQDVSFVVSGYGLQRIRPTEIRNTDRLQAVVRLTNLRSALTDGYNIHHTGAPGTGGGTCFGDSGGPIFNSAGAIVAVTSFGLNANCAGGGFGFRVDTAAINAWVESF